MFRLMLRIMLPVLVFTVLVLPALTMAVDPDTVNTVITFLPPAWKEWAVIGWAFLFYVVAPILKRLPAHTVAAKVGGYITQDTRPDPAGDAG